MAKRGELSERAKAFAREYYANGGDAQKAYLAVYDTDNKDTANTGAYNLLKRPEVLEYIKRLNVPQENKAIAERQHKREILWDFIHSEELSPSDRMKAMDILNKMDSEYIQQNVTVTAETTSIQDLDTETLERIARTS